MQDIKQEFVFGAIDFDNKIDALDQLNVAVYMLRGVSDCLVTLAEQNHDYQEVMRMLSDVTIYQSQVLSRIEDVLEEESTSKLSITESDLEKEDSNI